ncbi:ubiquitin-like autophagy protein Apg12 [Hypoxylon sp. FL1284]|nr:ubiquitin-like autophagy protein Apg12 [Hypoxylon sp. FL1284]
MEYPEVPEHPSPSPPASPIPDRPASPELPLTMTASAVLTALPQDASSALASAGEFEQDKILVRFKAVGSAPQLKREVRRISAPQKFEAVVTHLRKALRLNPTDGLFLYVNSAFAPALDEIVGNLHRCFKDSNDQLIVVYSITPAFG